jgi:hypothetical protein
MTDHPIKLFADAHASPVHRLAAGTFRTVGVIAELTSDDGRDVPLIVKAARDAGDNGLRMARATLDTLSEDDRERIAAWAQKQADTRLAWVVSELLEGCAHFGLNPDELTVGDIIALTSVSLRFDVPAEALA